MTNLDDYPELDSPAAARLDPDTVFLDMLTDNFSRMRGDDAGLLEYVLGQIEYIGTLGEEGKKLAHSLRVLEQKRDELKQLLGN